MIPGTHDSGAIRKFDGYFAGSIVNRFFMHYLGTFDVLPTYHLGRHNVTNSIHWRFVGMMKVPTIM